MVAFEAYAVKALQLKELRRADELKLVASLSLGSGALTDVITAATLCYYLRKLKTGYKESDHLVYKLSLYAINTGALTSVMSLGALIFYDLHPRTFQFMPFCYTLSRLYAISFLCTLNTRRVIHGHGTDRETSSAHNGDYGSPNSRNQHSRRSNNILMLPTHYVSSPTKSQLEVGVYHEISVITDMGPLGDEHSNLTKGPSSPPPT
ncbi:hypothetical protein PM082_003942 [Marasmius tenuissimus]|nr:hypothetical protein PM082_003942 [Marasmius tenuissimus]